MVQKHAGLFFMSKKLPASTRVAVGGFLSCLESTEYEKAQGVGKSRRSNGMWNREGKPRHQEGLRLEGEAGGRKWGVNC